MPKGRKLTCVVAGVTVGIHQHHGGALALARRQLLKLSHHLAQNIGLQVGLLVAAVTLGRTCASSNGVVCCKVEKDVKQV